MKSYLDLVPISAKVHRKQNRMPNNIMARVDKALAVSVSLKGGQNGQY